MDQSEIYEIIGFELSGNADKHQKEVLKSWMEESESNVKAYNVLRETWESTNINLNHPNEDIQFKKVLYKINASVRPKTFVSRHFIKIAASISIILVSVWFLVYNQSEVKQLEASVSGIEKSNPAGQKSNFLLPDGTKVWLNAESKLRYSTDYGKKDRQVELVGEAFFDVKKDASKEFVVKSENFTTTALGTSFNVQAFPNEGYINVSLVEGKVRVDQYRADSAVDISSKTYLRPGEQIIYDKSKNSLKKGDFNALETTLWKDGILYFDDTPFGDIVVALERWYGVKCSVKNAPEKEVLFSGVFENENLNNVLDAMSYSEKFAHKIDGKSVIIEFK
ncbi:FecR domain-containing protein [Reichenbachiella sp. MALMAid0571]|uniref:FecR family protein n=1 Tax=Reichenbachiella sp. MALMAid0571 TaxID=3143939 RepID=UPI0032DFB1E2